MVLDKTSIVRYLQQRSLINLASMPLFSMCTHAIDEKPQLIDTLMTATPHECTREHLQDVRDGMLSWQCVTLRLPRLPSRLHAIQAFIRDSCRAGIGLAIIYRNSSYDNPHL